MIKSSNSSIICWKFFFLSKSSSDAISLFKDEIDFFSDKLREQNSYVPESVLFSPCHYTPSGYAMHTICINLGRCNHEYRVSPSCILRARVKEAGIQEIMLRRQISWPSLNQTTAASCSSPSNSSSLVPF